MYLDICVHKKHLTIKEERPENLTALVEVFKSLSDLILQ